MIKPYAPVKYRVMNGMIVDHPAADNCGNCDEILTGDDFANDLLEKYFLYNDDLGAELVLYHHKACA